MTVVLCLTETKMYTIISMSKRRVLLDTLDFVILLGMIQCIQFYASLKWEGNTTIFCEIRNIWLTIFDGRNRQREASNIIISCNGNNAKLEYVTLLCAW